MGCGGCRALHPTGDQRAEPAQRHQPTPTTARRPLRAGHPAPATRPGPRGSRFHQGPPHSGSSLVMDDLVDITPAFMFGADQAVDGYGTGGTPDRTIRGADAEVLVGQKKLLRRSAFSFRVDLDGLSRPGSVLDDGTNSGSGAGRGLAVLVARPGMHVRVIGPWGPRGSGLVHRASPGARLDAPTLDELLEPLEVSLGLPLDHVQEVADLLHETFGLVLQTQAHQGPFGADGLEVDRAGVRDTAGRRPRDLLVGNLLEDGGVPFTLDPGDLRNPVQQGVAELLHLLYAAHELWELLELRPLVVGGTDRDVDLDGLLDVRGHCSSSPKDRDLASTRYPLPPAATPAKQSEEPGWSPGRVRRSNTPRTGRSGEDAREGVVEF